MWNIGFRKVHLIQGRECSPSDAMAKTRLSKGSKAMIKLESTNNTSGRWARGRWKYKQEYYVFGRIIFLENGFDISPITYANCIAGLSWAHLTRLFADRAMMKKKNKLEKYYQNWSIIRTKQSKDSDAHKMVKRAATSEPESSHRQIKKVSRTHARNIINTQDDYKHLYLSVQPLDIFTWGSGPMCLSLIHI